MRIAGIVNDSVVDGIGFRLTVFTQGCPHSCHGCHNPLTHALNGGKEVSVAEIKETIKNSPMITGITLSGGDPFVQPEACSELADYAHSLGLDVWAYSGWTYEELLKHSKRSMLLKKVDVLVDGPFLLAEKSMDCRFCGSKNQRLIDVPKSLEAGEAVLWEEEDFEEVQI